ncbi:MAG: hypothetical protein EP338_00150 [Bacteroidetes bacterium]|nr:MAG: hypothetical protein EP338_00150 [Bacteroidota bacterium]
MSIIRFYQGQQLLFDGSEENDDARITIVKNKIAELFNMKNVHFLFGSGTSVGAIPAMSGMIRAVEKSVEEAKMTELFELIRTNSKENLEETLGVLYSQRIYLEGIENQTEIEVDEDEDNDDIIGEDNTDEEELSELESCNKLIEVIEKTIYDEINVKFSEKSVKEVLENYKLFYQKVALRNKDLSRVNVFTTNNDLFNERALDSLNINYINGFSGGLTKFFNPAFFNYTYSKRMDTSIEKFEPVENMSFLYKLHGSVNWFEDESNANRFFNIREAEDLTRKKQRVLIYPTPTKQNKSLGSPYTELFREFQKKLLEPNSVLFVIGYSFSDEHVNNIIYQALATNSSINLFVLNHIKDKIISEVDDSRIFRFFEENDGDDTELTLDIFSKPHDKTKAHYFDYVATHLMPDVNTFKDSKDNLTEFLEHYKANLPKKKSKKKR